MDIVERLRKNCTCSEVGSTPCRFEDECQNAFDGADEIERLREALKEIADLSERFPDWIVIKKLNEFACNALKEKE